MTSVSNSTAASLQRGVTASTRTVLLGSESQQQEGTFERQRKVHFSEPLVSAAWSPPRESCQWKRLGRRGGAGQREGVFVVDATNSWRPELRRSPVSDVGMNDVENPMYTAGDHLISPEHSTACIKQDNVDEPQAIDDIFLNKGCRRYPACGDGGLFCGVGLAWILFAAGWLFFPLWYVGIFSRCITSHKREVYGSVACSVGALFVTAIALLFVLDAKELIMLYTSPSAQL